MASSAATANHSSFIKIKSSRHLTRLSMSPCSNDLYVETDNNDGSVVRYVLAAPPTMLSRLASIAIAESIHGITNLGSFHDVFIILLDIVPFGTRSGRRFTITFSVIYNDWRFSSETPFSAVFTLCD